MDNIEAGILILTVLCSLTGVGVLVCCLFVASLRRELDLYSSSVARAEHALTQALSQLTARASVAEELSRQLIEENRTLLRQQVQLSPDSRGRDFLEAQVERLTMALASSADLANARIMSLVNVQASAQVHAQTMDKSPDLRARNSQEHPDRFRAEPPDSHPYDTIEIPSSSPFRRPGEAEVIDRIREVPYTPEEHLEGVGLDDAADMATGQVPPEPR